MFVAHIRLEDFVANVGAAGITRAYMQPFSRTHSDAFPVLETSILLTAAPESDGPIFVARIELERLSLHPAKHRSQRAAAATRQERAAELLARHLHAELNELLISPGMLLNPGMLADVLKVETQPPDLWRWVQDGDDTSTRRILPYNDPTTS